MTTHTTVHLLRHGEVHNPNGVLYGRMDGYHLSDLGRQMAHRVADALERRDIAHVVASPLERAQETAAPVARTHGLEVGTDSRVISFVTRAEICSKCFGDGSTWAASPGMPLLAQSRWACSTASSSVSA